MHQVSLIRTYSESSLLRPMYASLAACAIFCLALLLVLLSTILYMPTQDLIKTGSKGVKGLLATMHELPRA